MFPTCTQIFCVTAMNVVIIVVIVKIFFMKLLHKLNTFRKRVKKVVTNK
jgi:hypothetical protein